VDVSSIQRNDGWFSAKITGGPPGLSSQPLELAVTTFESGSARVKITEQNGKRWEVSYVLLLIIIVLH
jgi:hypothetical protein